MRVAYVNQDPGVGPGRRKGAAAHVAALQSALRELGCEVLAVERKDDAGVLAELERAHAQRPLDWLYERHSLGAVGAARFARARGVPLLLEVNAPLFDEARAHRGFEATPEDFARQRMCLESAAWLLPVSRSVARYLVDHGAPTGRIHVLPNAVDTRLFHPGVERAEDFAAPPDALAVGFHGRLRPWHNLPLLGRALEHVLDAGAHVRVLAVGEGDFARALGPRVAEHLAQREWMAHEELARHVACFDVLPLSYAPDAELYFSPLKLFEAMACGVTPLVPELGELPQIVGFGSCGGVYPAGDERALAQQLLRWIERPDERRRLGLEAARATARRSWVDVGREVMALALTTRGVERGAQTR